jgi:hypothetical protein
VNHASLVSAVSEAICNVAPPGSRPPRCCQIAIEQAPCMRSASAAIMSGIMSPIQGRACTTSTKSCSGASLGTMPLDGTGELIT